MPVRPPGFSAQFPHQLDRPQRQGQATTDVRTIDKLETARQQRLPHMERATALDGRIKMIALIGIEQAHPRRLAGHRYSNMTVM